MKTLTRLSRLIRNDGGPAAPAAKDIVKDVQQHFTCNLLPKIVRHDSMEGEDYLVVPSVILMEGVHRGSEGPLFYPKEELEKTPAVWNHKPVVVYHPEINGQGVSACDPAILTNRKIGLMMNTNYDTKQGRLTTEVWLKKERANLVDERIMNAVEKGEMMELSTGVFVDCEKESGEWGKGKEKYIGIARNYRPDHLAILPDKIGACSISDGAGFLRNEDRDTSSMFKKFLEYAGIARNELSFNSISDQLRTALIKRLAINLDKGPWLWVADVYSNFVVYEHGAKLYRLGYSATDTGVVLDNEEPKPVVRVTEYRTVEGAFVGNKDSQDQQTITKNTMEKKKVVDAILVAAAAIAGSWSEADRESLMAMNEAQLTKVQNSLPKEKKEEPAAPAPAPAPKAKEEPATPPKKVTANEYIAEAPAEVREVLNESMAALNEEKNRLIDGILANEGSGFTKEELTSYPLSNLRKMARLAGVKAAPATRTANYGGQGHVPTENEDKEEALGVPTLNFAPASAAK